MRNTLVVVGLLSIVGTFSWCQEITREVAYPMRWDSTHGVAFVGTGIAYPTHAPLRSYSESGVKRGPDINIFRDFHDVDHVLIDDVAAGPEGATVLTGILNFGKHLRHVVLWYTSDGKLKTVIDTEPYYGAAVTVDDAGTIYLLANRIDIADGKAAYPLLLAYDSEGRLLSKGLSSSSLKRGYRSINDAADHSAAVLAIVENHLAFYAPESRELITCTFAGSVMTRADVSGLLTKFGNDDNAVTVMVQSVSFSGKNALVQFVTTRKDGTRKFRIATINLESSDFSVLRVTQKATWKMLGAHGPRYAVIEMSPGTELKTFEMLQ